MKTRVLMLNLIISFLLVGPVFAVQTVDRILVIVNDEIITSRDLQGAMEPVLAQYRASLSGPELEEKRQEAENLFLKRLVDERLIRSAAKRKGVEVESSEVDDMVETIRAKFPSQEAFEQVMAQQGMTFKQLRGRFEDQILRRRMVDIQINSRMSVSPMETKAYYDANPDQFLGPRTMRVRQILIRMGAERTETEAREFADSILKEMWDGASMAELARRHSEGAERENGGDMGWVEKGQLVDYIDRQIFRLKVGEYSDPVKTQLGYHIFKVEDVREPVIKPYEQVRRRVESFLFKKKSQERLGEWLAELREEAFIKYQV